ncbi:MAG: PDZ domain-containing protein [Peptococcaceae bacterium]|nr:PDZ domain-containing protein [Peptococcaceae bacterium]
MAARPKQTMLRLFFIFCFVFTVITGPGHVYASEDPVKAQKTILEVFNYLKQNHINQPSVDQLMEGAIWGMIDTLEDPYTSYLSEEELKKLTEDLNGDYEGVGLYLEGKPDYPRVQEVFPNSPAAQGGIKAGDIIKEVNGVDVFRQPLPEVVEKIKGPVGTEVVLGIDREGTVLNVRLKRAHLNVPSVESKVIGRSTGYIAVKSFGMNTPEEFKTKLDELRSRNITGLVIDLRDNPGGYLTAALKMAETFLKPDAVILITKIYDGSVERYLADENAETVKIPVVILVNSLTASSAEILTAALQDNGVATLVGEKTYGKGVAQSIIDLKSGGALKITTTEYTTPKGRRVNDIGLTPDFQVLTRELQLPFALGLLEPRPKQIEFTPGSSEVAVDSVKMLTRNKPVIRNTAVFLPLRFTLEALGYVVSWEETTGKITAQKRNVRIIIPATGNPLLNGREITTENTVYIDEGVSYIALDLIKALGFTCRQAEGRIIIEG